MKQKLRDRRRALSNWWNSLRFGQLLVLIVAVMVLTPFVSAYPLLLIVFQLIFLNAVIVTLSSVHGHRALFRALFLGLWVAALALRIIHLSSSEAALQHALVVASGVLEGLLLAACAVLVLRHVLSRRQITSDTIMAAVVAYLLMALVFASVYGVMQTVNPDNFRMTAERETWAPLVQDELVYFSFVTIATLGYGDIVPVLPMARVLSVIEAVFGQFYIAVIVAWLVSTYATKKPQAS